MENMWIGWRVCVGLWGRGEREREGRGRERGGREGDREEREREINRVRFAPVSTCTLTPPSLAVPLPPLSFQR